MDAFAFSAASDAAETLAGVGGCHNFEGCGGVFRANRSQLRRPWRAVYVYRRRPASMPDHGVHEGVVRPLRLCVRGLGSCALGGDVRRWQGVKFDDF